MVILLDLNAPIASATEPPWDEPFVDTVMLIATPRKPEPRPHEPAPAKPLDDLDLATWEDAEWQ